MTYLNLLFRVYLGEINLYNFILGKDLGNCIYCGKPAGMFKKKHKQCSENSRKAIKQISDYSLKFLASKAEGKKYASGVTELARRAMLTPSEKSLAIISGLNAMVDSALDDNYLSEEEESRIVEYINGFEISLQDEHPDLAAKLVKAAIIRDLSNGKMASRISSTISLPVKLQKSESVIWFFENVSYWEQKTRTQYVGGSKGISVRVAKGVYIRGGASKGERIQTKEMHNTDEGILVITDKNIYFSGSNKSFRIAGNKIISVEQLHDGVSVFKEAANPKPQIFELDDPWFAANLINHI